VPAAIRVLHVATGNLYGGVEVFLHTLARPGGAGETAAEFTVCWGGGRLAKELRATGAQVHDLGEVRLSRPWQVFRARRRLAEMLQAQPPEVAVLHSGWTHAVFGPVFRRYRIPLVMGVHTVVPQGSRLERWARRIPLKAVFANSRFTAASAHGWYPGCAEPEVLYLPVETPVALPAPIRADLRRQLGAQPEDCVILQASRLQPLKGQKTLLMALVALKAQPGWRCWLAGGAQRPEEEVWLAELRTFVLEQGLGDRVMFLGQRDDVPALLAAADVVCQVNAEPEAFGLIYVEALAAGKPVIAANQGGVTEVVDSSCGALLPPGASEALAGVLREWVGDPSLRSRLGAAGRARAAARCDVRRQIEALNGFLERARDGHKKKSGG